MSFVGVSARADHLIRRSTKEQITPQSGNQLYTRSERERFELLADGCVGPDVLAFSSRTHPKPVSAGNYMRYVVTAVGASTFGPGVFPGDRITIGAANGDGVNAQTYGSAFQVGAEALYRELYCGCRFRVSHASNVGLFFGLAVESADVLSGVTDRIGFEKAAGAADVVGILEAASTETATAALAAIVADRWIRLGLYVEAKASAQARRVVWTVNGEVVTIAAELANLPEAALLRPTLQVKAADVGGFTVDLDFLDVVQVGR